jgi:hypothetical protein
MEEFNYEKDLEIDKNSLDTECLDQPARFMKYSKAYADAGLERDQKKQELVVERADLSMKIRNDPGEYGLDKVTEGSVQTALDTSKKIVGLTEELNQVQNQVNILGSAKEAFEHRRDMIKILAQLFVSGYWSKVSMPQGASDKMSEAGTQEQKEGLKARLNKKRMG